MKQYVYGFDKMQFFLRLYYFWDDFILGLYLKDDKVLKEEEDFEFDLEIEDEEELKRFLYRKLKSQKFGKGYL